MHACVCSVALCVHVCINSVYGGGGGGGGSVGVMYKGVPSVCISELYLHCAHS